jgi:MFS family permease
MLAFSSGLGFYSHTVFIAALSSDLGFDLEVASGAVSVFFLFSGVAGLVIAGLLERFDVRLIMGLGTVLAAGALASLGQVQTMVELYVVYAVFGIGFSGSGLLPATTLIARWFENNRARALSVASTGLSIGGVLITPPCAALIESFGMRVASPWMGLAYLVGIMPVCILVLRSAPGETGNAIDGRHADAGSAGSTLSEAFHTPYFWAMNIAFVFVMLAQVGGIAHQYGLVREQLSVEQAAYAIGVLPLFSIIGRLGGGMIIDRLSTSRFTVTMMVSQTAALILMALAPSVPTLLIGLAVFGITVGNLLMLQPLLIAETFGIAHYSRIYSWTNLLSMMGLAAGPAFMGYVYTFEDSYRYPYLLAGASGFTACVVYLLVKQPTGVRLVQ